MDTPCPAPIIISFKLSPLIFFQTRIIFLHAHPQVVYYNCVKYQQYRYRRSSTYKKYGQTDTDRRIDRQVDSYIPPKPFLCGVKYIHIPGTYKNCLQKHTKCYALTVKQVYSIKGFDICIIKRRTLKTKVDIR